MGLLHFLPLTQSPLDLAAGSGGDFRSWHWNAGLGAWCGAGTPLSEISLPKFHPPQVGVESSLFASLPLLPDGARDGAALIL